MTNRNPVKRIFITWPQTSHTKQELLEFLTQSLNVSYLLISQETHEDGGLHLHACVLTNDEYSAGHYVKLFKNKYPSEYKRIHVKPCRSFPHSHEYLLKEDTDPLTYGKLPKDQDPVEKRLRRTLRGLGTDRTFVRGIYDQFLRSEPDFKYLYLLEEYLAKF